MAVILSNNRAQIGGLSFETNPAETPFLSLIGLNTDGKGKYPQGFIGPKFLENVKGGARKISWTNYTGRDPVIGGSKENQSAPTPDFTNKEQLENIVTIFDDHTVAISDYAEITAGEQKKSDGTALDNNTGILTDEQIDILTEETENKIEDLKKDVEVSYLFSEKVVPTNASVTAPKMSGLFEFVPSANVIDVASGPFTESHMDAACSILADNFAGGDQNLVFMGDYLMRQKLSKMYGVPVRDRMVGGLDVYELIINGFKIRIIDNAWFKVMSKNSKAIIFNPDNIDPIGLDAKDDFGTKSKVVLKKVFTDKSSTMFRLMAYLSIAVRNPKKLVSFDNLPLV